MSSHRTTEKLVCANRSLTNTDWLVNETELSKAVDAVAQAPEDLHCELFEGGLGI